MICFLLHKAEFIGIAANLIFIGLIGYILVLLIIYLNLSIRLLRKKLEE